MLNVAVTRAKKRCYIIGNKKLWIKQPIFAVADEILCDIATITQTL